MAALSKSKQFLLWIAAALVATGALGAILIWEHRPTDAKISLYVIGVPEKGAALFFGEKHCAICHSVNGSGGRLAPDLGRSRPGKPPMAWLTTVLWNHAPGMLRQMRSGKPPVLSQEEMAHILAFLYQAGTTDRAGDANAGRQVFQAKGCSRCHSIDSVGGQSGPDLSRLRAARDSVVWMHAMWNHAQSMIEPVTRELGKWPQFTGAEMSDLIAYVSSGGPAPKPGAVIRGSPQKGWQVFEVKCIRCHAVRGKGGQIGPELGPDHDLPHTPTQFAAVLWNHAPAMMEQARAAGVSNLTLQGDEISDLLQFLASLQYVEPTGSPFLGETAFRERGCARCHGPKAEGTSLAPKLLSGPTAMTSVSLATSLWRHVPEMIRSTEKLGMPWPTLEPADVGDLISFLNAPEQRQ